MKPSCLKSQGRTNVFHLGLKQLQQNPWELLEERSPIGSKIIGRIRNLTSFGAFVEIEPGIDGLIHTSDLSWTKRGAAANEELKEGSEIEVGRVTD